MESSEESVALALRAREFPSDRASLKALAYEGSFPPPLRSDTLRASGGEGYFALAMG
jgi:hypothetical protein